MMRIFLLAALCVAFFGSSAYATTIYEQLPTGDVFEPATEDLGASGWYYIDDLSFDQEVEFNMLTLWGVEFENFDLDVALRLVFYENDGGIPGAEFYSEVLDAHANFNDGYGLFPTQYDAFLPTSLILPAEDMFISVRAIDLPFFYAWGGAGEGNGSYSVFPDVTVLQTNYEPAYRLSMEQTVVPEPATMSLILLGIAALACRKFWTVVA